MDINEFQQWMKKFKEENSLSQDNIFMDVGLLAEGTGTVACAIKGLETAENWPDTNSFAYRENKQLLIDGLGDMLGNLSFIASQYDIDLDKILQSHQQKVTQRYTTLNN